MGNCLGKKKQCKRNDVAPAPDDDVCERISRATPRPGCSFANQTDMTKQLEESHFEESKITAGGVSFVIDLQEGDPERMPSRLVSRMDGACTPEMNDDKVHYTTEERELLAELYREDILREKREKALQGTSRFTTLPDAGLLVSWLLTPRLVRLRTGQTNKRPILHTRPYQL